MLGDAASDNLFRILSQSSHSDDDARMTARREIALRKSQVTGYLVSPYAMSRPRLDGKLDDPLWEEMLTGGKAILKKMKTSSSDTSPMTDVVMISHDDQFFFFAARCNRVKGHDYSSSSSVRSRDPDLTGRDRVQVSLDIDRDNHAEFQLIVDQRGWAADGIRGSTGWNPQWYIDTAIDDRAWTVEFALPIDEVFGESTGFAAISLNRFDYNARDLWADNPDQSRAETDEGIMSILDRPSYPSVLLKFVKPELTAKKAGDARESGEPK
jgi:hypothetical protein